METYNFDKFIDDKNTIDDLVKYIDILNTKSITFDSKLFNNKLNNKIYVEALINKIITPHNFIFNDNKMTDYYLKIYTNLIEIIPDKNICVEIIEEVLNYSREFEQNNYFIINNKLKEVFNKLNYIFNNNLVLDLVINSKLTPHKLVYMKPSELSDKFNTLNKQSIQELEIDMLKTPMNQTTKFKCPKCKKNQCSFIEKQIRSADEPMTAFITCNNCNYNWKE